MQYSQLYEDTVLKLSQVGIIDAHVDAILLFEFCFGLTRSDLFLNGSNEVNESKLKRFHTALERRLTREPLQYITGSREFWSLDFFVSPAVLVPRPETEFVIDSVLSALNTFGYQNGPLLDMCTGSGVIAVVLARELKPDLVIAVDSSMEALLVADQNVQKYELENTISLLCSNLFTALNEKEQYEVIVSNPPYIAAGEIEHLQPEVRDWEPHSALTAGLEGLDVIEEIVVNSHEYLVPGGWLFVEIGADQEHKIHKLFMDFSSNVYENFTIQSDWSGRPRLMIAQKKW